MSMEFIREGSEVFSRWDWSWTRELVVSTAFGTMTVVGAVLGAGRGFLSARFLGSGFGD